MGRRLTAVGLGRHSAPATGGAHYGAGEAAADVQADAGQHGVECGGGVAAGVARTAAAEAADATGSRSNRDGVYVGISGA